MLDPRFKIQPDALYDRAPAELSLDALAEFFDAAGAPLAERPLQSTRKERLQLELTQQRCDYIVDPLLQDASTVLATQFMQEARVLLDPTHAATAAAPPASVVPTEAAQKPAGIVPANSTTTMASPLSFKATLLDENSNLILEGGERIRVRVDIVNTGAAAVDLEGFSLAGVTFTFPAGATIEPNAVSYTHLDVYKRQALDVSIEKAAARCYTDRGRPRLRRDRETQCPPATTTTWCSSSTTTTSTAMDWCSCLLYTSRCV